MRAFTACLTVVLSLGAFSLVACSSDATTTASGGGAGEAATDNGGGGQSSTAGTSGIGQAGACAFDSQTCSDCVTTNCADQATTCSNDATCGSALTAIEGCICGGTSLDTCESNFAKDGGDPAAPLVTCFNANCASSCM